MRINHSTEIIPEGVYKVKESEGEENQGFEEIAKIEEPVAKPLDFYWSIENWLHLNPEINRVGRVTAEELEFVNPELDDEAKDKIRAEINQIRKPKPRLVPIVADKCKLKSGQYREMLDFEEERPRPEIPQPDDWKAGL